MNGCEFLFADFIGHFNWVLILMLISMCFVIHIQGDILFVTVIVHVVSLLFILVSTFFIMVELNVSNLYSFYAPGSNDRGHIVFVLAVCLFVCLSVRLSVCLSVVNFNLRYNFWTVRDRDFIFGMHTPLMTPFQMTPRSMTLWSSLWPWS